MKKKKVTLVRMVSNLINVYSSFFHPGLALPILGAILKNRGYEVAIYVESLARPPLEEMRKSDVVGFSVNSTCFQETYAMAERLRRLSDCTIVFGGPHVTYLAEEALQYGDFVVRGEGEETFPELLETLEQGGDLGTVRGISWIDRQGWIRHNPDRPLTENLDTIPDYSLVKGFSRQMARLRQKLFPMGMLVSSSRGCMHHCSFCMIPGMFGKRIRFRDPDTVIEDIRRQVHFSQDRYIYFTDDNFAQNPRYTKALLRKIIRERLNIRFSAQVRCEITLDPELMALMREAGAYLVFVGLESIEDASLQFYKKGGKQTRRQIESSIAEFNRHGLLVHGMFVVGADTDGPGAARAISEWALQHGLDSIQILPICPLPGTEILQKMERENRVIRCCDPKRHRPYIRYGVGNYVLVRPKQMEAAALQREILEAHRLFYNYANALRRLKHIFRKGLEPIVYQVIGCLLVRKIRSDIRDYIAWLDSNQAPSGGLGEEDCPQPRRAGETSRP